MQSLKTNTKTLNIGGDHTMGLGTVSAFLEYFVNKEKVIIWLDAHADVNTRKASKSGHYHGMPVAFLLGLDKDEKFPINVLLKPEELIYVGLRDVDLFEKNQVRIKKVIRLSAYLMNSGKDEQLIFDCCRLKYQNRLKKVLNYKYKNKTKKLSYYIKM